MAHTKTAATSNTFQPEVSLETSLGPQERWTHNVTTTPLRTIDLATHIQLEGSTFVSTVPLGQAAMAFHSHRGQLVAMCMTASVSNCPF